MPSWKCPWASHPALYRAFATESSFESSISKTLESSRAKEQGDNGDGVERNPGKSEDLYILSNALEYLRKESG